MGETLLFVVITCLGVLVQSFAGFAGALCVVPLFAILLPLKEAIPAYSLVVLVINLWLVFETRRHLEPDKLGKLLLGGVLGIPVGALSLKHLPVEVLSLAVSLVTCAFAVLFLLNVRFRLADKPRTQIGVGLASGFLGGCIAQAGPPVVFYGLARNWEKDTFRTTLLAYFTCLCAELILIYAWLGMYATRNLRAAATAAVPAFVTACCGVALKNRVSETLFRQMTLVVVLAVGVVSLSRPLWAR
ncbi:MAG: sulfite exporter TauE/SafE family protein [Phycisphaerae bacterium]|jgi:hypothetical protein